MKHYIIRFLLSLICVFNVFAQSGLCDPTVPFYNVNLSGQPAGIWTSTPPIQRVGNCCGTTAPDKCIEFQILSDPAAVAINFNRNSSQIHWPSKTFKIILLNLNFPDLNYSLSF